MASAGGLRVPIILLFVLYLFQIHVHCQSVSPAALPLRVISVTPSVSRVDLSGQHQSRVMISGNDAITVTFSRPVIALGSDYSEGELPRSLIPFTLEGNRVPGKLRWVTTYMARFDADIAWPANVEFELVFNNELVSYDGVSLDIPSDLEQRVFYTNHVQFTLSSVSSAIAQELTANQWNSFTTAVIANGEWSHLPEVPPDAHMIVMFQSQIDRDLVEEFIYLQGGSHYVPLIIESCSISVDRCLNISLTEPLNVESTYQLVLPVGSSFHKYSNPTTIDINFSVSGLYGFKFALFNPQPDYWFPQYSRYRMYLRHGLSADTDLEELKSSISISPSLEFTLTQPHASFVEILANFEPSTEYEIRIQANENVLDGYGLALQANSAVYQTAEAANVLLGAHANRQAVIFERSQQPLEWTYLVRNAPEGSSIRAGNVNSLNLKKALVSLVSDRSFTTDEQELVLPTNSQSLEAVHFDMSKLLGSSSMFMVEEFHTSWGHRQKYVKIVSFSDLSVSVFQLNSCKLLAWVTSMVDGKPVSGAKVSLYTMMYGSSSVDSVSVASESTTNSDGLVTLSGNCNGQHTHVVLVSSGESLMFAGDVYLSNYESTAPIRSSIITDRELYRPGETVYVKGFVRQTTMPSSVPSSELQLDIWWSDEADEPQTVFVTPSHMYGSFDAKFEVPLDAQYGYHSISCSRRNGEVFASQSILVGDPRPPTVVLNETALQEIYNPEFGLELDISTTTYVGTPVALAKVTLRWELIRGSNANQFVTSYLPTDASAGCFWTSSIAIDSSDRSSGERSSLEGASGELVVETDINGHAHYTLMLTDEHRPIEGDSIVVRAEWVGPTGELVQDSVSRVVASSELQLSLETTVTPVLPAFPFALNIQCTDQRGDTIGDNAPVAIALYHWDGRTPLVPDTTTGVVDTSALGTAVQTCTARRLSTPTAQCTLTVPALGRFVIVASTTDLHGRTVSSTLPVGRTQAEWESKPLADLSAHAPVAHSTEYHVGDTAKFSLFNPYASMQALIVQANGNGHHTKRVLLEHGMQTISVPIDATCFGTCSFQIALAVARQASRTMTVDVPTSVLFDPLAPFTLLQSYELFVSEPNPLVLSVTLASEAVEPGTETSMELELTSDGAPAEGEVCVFLVDKSWLDLAPPMVDDLERALAPDNPAYTYGMALSSDALALNEAYNRAKEILQRRLEQDLWLRPSWPLQSYAWVSTDLDLSDEEYFSNFATDITQFPYGSHSKGNFGGGGGGGGGFSPELSALPAAAPRPTGVSESESFSADDAGVNRNGASSDGNSGSVASGAGRVHVRKDFTVTPFHAFSERVSLSNNGRLRLSFKAPESVGSFVVRAFAINKHGHAATAEAVQVVRQRVGSLVANMPRIVRLGDVFSAGGAFTLSVPDQFRGTLTAQLEIDCEMVGFTGAPTQQVRVTTDNAYAPIEMLFSLRALRPGTALYRLIVSLEGQTLDAFESTITVLAPQEEVFVCTSMAIEATSAGGVWQEGLALPDAVPFTGKLTLEAGVGHLPAVITYSRALSHIPTWSSCIDVLGWLVPRAVLDQYPSADGRLTRSADALFRQSVAALSSFTDSTYGLQWFTPYTQPTHTASLNAYGLYVAQRTKALLGRPGKLPSSLTDVWSSALENALYWEIDSMAGHFYDWDLLAATYVAFGHTWTPVRHSTLLSWESLLSHINDCSSTGKANVALALLYAEQKDSATVASIVEYLFSTLRVQGRTAYVSYGSGSSHADVSASALALEVFLLAEIHEPAVEKLAAFVAQQNQPSTDPYGSSGWGSQQLAYASFALATYDAVRGNTKPNVDMRVLYRENSLLDAHFQGTSAAPVNITVPFESLYALDAASGSPDADELEFYTRGKGEISVVAGLRFVPSGVTSQPVYRGISVLKIVQRVNLATGEAYGPAVTKLTRGDRVRVTITISTPDDLRNVLAFDPLPGGIEALDENIFDISSSSSSSSPGYYPGRAWWWYYAGFTQKEFHKEGVRFFAQWLFAGTHTVQYDATVVTRGNFVVPSCKAWCVLEPEVMGLSSASVVSTTTTPLPSAIATGHDAFCMHNTNAPVVQVPSFDEVTFHNDLSVSQSHQLSGWSNDEGDDRNEDGNSLDWRPFMAIVAIAGAVLVVFSVATIGVLMYIRHRRNRRPASFDLELDDEI